MACSDEEHIDGPPRFSRGGPFAMEAESCSPDRRRAWREPRVCRADRARITCLPGIGGGSSRLLDGRCAWGASGGPMFVRTARPCPGSDEDGSSCPPDGQCAWRTPRVCRAVCLPGSGGGGSSCQRDERCAWGASGGPGRCSFALRAHVRKAANAARAVSGTGGAWREPGPFPADARSVHFLMSGLRRTARAAAPPPSSG